MFISSVTSWFWMCSCADYSFHAHITLCWFQTWNAETHKMHILNDEYVQYIYLHIAIHSYTNTPDITLFKHLEWAYSELRVVFSPTSFDQNTLTHSFLPHQCSKFDFCFTILSFTIFLFYLFSFYTNWFKLHWEKKSSLLKLVLKS